MQKEFCVCQSEHIRHQRGLHLFALSNNQARTGSPPSSDRRRTNSREQASYSQSSAWPLPLHDRCERRERAESQRATCPRRRAQSFLLIRDKQNSKSPGNLTGLIGQV